MNFPNLSAFEMHRRIPVRPVDNESSLHMCDTCGKSFIDERAKLQHLSYAHIIMIESIIL
jgi:uncharacterized UBP type Zn finger protein